MTDAKRIAQLKKTLAAAEKAIAAYRDLLDARVTQLRAENEALADRLSAAQKVVQFFASAIKSGEPWTPACQQALDAALSKAEGGEGQG